MPLLSRDFPDTREATAHNSTGMECSVAKIPKLKKRCLLWGCLEAGASYPNIPSLCNCPSVQHASLDPLRYPSCSCSSPTSSRLSSMKFISSSVALRWWKRIQTTQPATNVAMASPPNNHRTAGSYATGVSAIPSADPNAVVSRYIDCTKLFMLGGALV